MRVQGASRLRGWFVLAAACIGHGAGLPALAQAPFAPPAESSSAAPRVDPGREAQLEARVRQLEAKIGELSRRLDASPRRAPAGSAKPGPTPPAPRFDMPAPVPNPPYPASFGRGFELKTVDDEYLLQFHNLYTIDFGVNWYWTQYVKVAIFWEHAEFGNPVLYRPGARQKTSDLFLLRLQLRF